MGDPSFIRRRAALLGLCGALAGLVPPAQAQPYPDRPIRLIVPIAPGGGLDTIARAERAKWAKVIRGAGIQRDG